MTKTRLDRLDGRMDEIDKRRHDLGNHVNNEMTKIRSDMADIEVRTVANTNDISALNRAHIDIKDLVNDIASSLKEITQALKEMAGEKKGRLDTLSTIKNLLKFIGGAFIGAVTITSIIWGIVHSIN